MAKQPKAFSTRILGASRPVPALWNDGNSQEDRQVLVKAEMSPDRLVLLTPEGKECEVLPMETVELFPPKDAQPMRLSWQYKGKAALFSRHAQRNGRLLVEDEDAARELLPHLASCIDGVRRSSIRRKCIIVFGAWVAISLIYSIAPLFFSMGAGRISRDMEDSMGASARAVIATVFSHLPDSGGECALREGRAEVDRLKTRLAQARDTGDHIFDIVFLDSPMINAFALPGGVILLTTGLLRACASAEELAGVVAVKMEHIIHRHPSKLMLREEGWSVFVRWLIGLDYSAVATGEFVRLALAGSFDLEQEETAASFAAQRLAAAGIHIPSAAGFFSRLRAIEEPAYGTLPSYAARHRNMAKQEQILRAAADAREGSAPAFDVEAWMRLRQASCQAPAAPTK